MNRLTQTTLQSTPSSATPVIDRKELLYRRVKHIIAATALGITNTFGVISCATNNQNNTQTAYRAPKPNENKETAKQKIAKLTEKYSKEIGEEEFAELLEQMGHPNVGIEKAANIAKNIYEYGEDEAEQIAIEEAVEKLRTKFQTMQNKYRTQLRQILDDGKHPEATTIDIFSKTGPGISKVRVCVPDLLRVVSRYLEDLKSMVEKHLRVLPITLHSPAFENGERAVSQRVIRSLRKEIGVEINSVEEYIDKIK